MAARPDDSPALVLVADDERDIVTLVALRLERAGYEVVTAGSGEQALALALERRPDVAVLDVRMPGLDGYQLTARLRAEPTTAKIPIILFSASVHQANVDRGFEVGATAYLRKPFNPTTLLAEIERALEKG
jgi:CheY-like chemotaxis protein